jgi:hypothetical protein
MAITIIMLIELACTQESTSSTELLRGVGAGCCLLTCSQAAKGFRGAARRECSLPLVVITNLGFGQLWLTMLGNARMA